MPPRGTSAYPATFAPAHSGPMMAVADTLHLLLPLIEVDRWMRDYHVSVE